MPETTWINGRFLTREEARISAFDAGLLHGVGLFETMLALPLAGDEHATRGRVFRIQRHMERLEASARALGLTDSLRVRALQELVEHVAERSGVTAAGDADPASPTAGAARVRLTITGGDLNLLSSTGQGPADPTVIIHAQPATRYPPEMFQRGVTACIGRWRANPLDPAAGHKTLDYWTRLRELRSAAARGAGEAIILQVTGHICGGAVSNLFAVRGGALVTPVARGEEPRLGGEDLPSPVLPGVTRSAIIDAAAGLRIGCDRRNLHPAELHDADEVFLTNSSWGVLPVVAIESRAVGDGRPGPITEALRQKWIELIRTEP